MSCLFELTVVNANTDGCGEDPVILHDEVLNIMIAGRDTVS